MSHGKIVILGTGGTIAGTAGNSSDNIGYTAAQVSVSQLLDAIPALQGRQIETEQVAQLDSKDMGFAVWSQLALRCEHWLAQENVQGLVITHGTDTLEETAFFLHSVLVTSKPVVLTCAMRPSTALIPDGRQNLLDAVAVASAPGAKGVIAVCAGVVHGAREIQKVHTYRLDAFSSGDCGPIAYVEEGALRRFRDWPLAGPVNGIPCVAKLAQAERWPWVEIVVSHAGASGRLVDALKAQGVGGIVVAGTGNGTVHQDLESALLRAQSCGVRVVRSTRCIAGVVLPMANDRMPDSAGLSPVKARVALILELMNRA